MLDQRMVDHGELFHGVLLEDGAVGQATMVNGAGLRRADGPRDPAGGPGATFQHARQREPRCGDTQFGADGVGDLAEQGDGQGPPLETASSSTSLRAVGESRIQRREHAGVEKQSTVAILGQTGETVEAGHRVAAQLQGFDERIRGFSLRQLVERHPAGAGAVAEGRVEPAVTQRHNGSRLRRCSIVRRPDGDR